VREVRLPSGAVELRFAWTTIGLVLLAVIGAVFLLPAVFAVATGDWDRDLWWSVLLGGAIVLMWPVGRQGKVVLEPGRLRVITGWPPVGFTRGLTFETAPELRLTSELKEESWRAPHGSVHTDRYSIWTLEARAGAAPVLIATIARDSSELDALKAAIERFYAISPNAL
jgi:hypothetical protein